MTAHWIDRLAEGEAQKEIAYSLRVLAEAKDAQAIQGAVSSFWEDLKSALEVAKIRLEQNESLRISASMSDHSEADFENRIRFQVISRSLSPQVAYTDIFHLVGDSEIRCHTMTGSSYKLFFGIRSGSVGVYGAGNAAIMSPEKTAEHILRPMVDQVLRKSRSR